MNTNKKLFILASAIVIFLCLVLFSLGLFSGYSVLKSIKFVVYSFLIFGLCAAIWIIGGVIYDKLQITKHGETVIVVAFIALLVAVCVIAGLLK